MRHQNIGKCTFFLRRLYLSCTLNRLLKLLDKMSNSNKSGSNESHSLAIVKHINNMDNNVHTVYAFTAQ